MYIIRPRTRRRTEADRQGEKEKVDGREKEKRGTG